MIEALPKCVERCADSIPCECGGYMDRVEVTPEEDEEFGCGRTWNCCSRAFVCRICKKRHACAAEAPEME